MVLFLNKVRAIIGAFVANLIFKVITLPCWQDWMIKMLIQLKRFFQKETVFCVSLVLALLSTLAVRPDAVYLTYPDYRTLALLFCLMLIVSGFQSLGVFERLGHALLHRAGNLRSLSIVRVLLCFFSSMIITNDVTLITFVPFTLLVFRMIGKTERVLLLVVLETIAANLGSMATPIGNPQNLYLFSISSFSLGQFAWAVMPYAGLSLVLLLAVLLLQRNEPLPASVSVSPVNEAHLFPALLPFLFLLVLCLLVVFRVISYVPALIGVTAVVLVVNRKLFRSVDYCLLFTFLFFFIFIGNLKRIPALNTALLSLVNGHELCTGILASQIISNVPAAILLSGFTQDYATLLTAVNLGGLGTLIASLASLIAFKFYGSAYPERKGAFLKVFTLFNVGFLLVLTGLALILI